jgi:4a-hydroxytetrahydrobiopterin dehydratase
MALAGKRCRPCEGGVPKLGPTEASALHAEIPSWELAGDRLRRRFTFPDFTAAIAFVNRMAAVAEAEDHHPDFAVHYRRVDVELWTHAVGGLSENDFILAAKIDALAG